MKLDIEHILGVGGKLDFPTLLPLRGACREIRFLVDKHLATVNALDAALRMVGESELADSFGWQPPCFCYINSLPNYGTGAEDNAISQWVESLCEGYGDPEGCGEGLMPFTSTILSRILNFRGPVILPDGSAEGVWCEIAAMPVFTSMPEVAQACSAFTAGARARNELGVWVIVAPSHMRSSQIITAYQELTMNMASVRCLMQILVCRHHLTFTFLHVKLLGDFVTDREPIAEIRQIFYEEPK